jgi:hypothetical protein
MIRLQGLRGRRSTGNRRIQHGVRFLRLRGAPGDGRYLDRADPEKGRFRSLILTSLKFLVADEEDRDRARKRGGGVLVPLEFPSAEKRYQREPAHDETPERIFEQRWALSVLDRIVERLRSEFVQHGHAIEGVPARKVRDSL